jgi:uncharacterized protein with GYD domain
MAQLVLADATTEGIVPSSSKDCEMYYVTLMKFTDQGSKNVKGTVERTQQNRKLMEAAGGKMHSVFWTQGAYDLVALVEWQDEDAAMAFLLQLGMGGNVTTETLRAYDETEMQRILAKL